MKKKVINFSDPLIKFEEFNKIVFKVFKKNFVSEGPITKEFEKKIAKLINIKHVMITSSGSAALVLALKGLNIKPGDEVIIPNLTFQATANAVNMVGGKVVLCDINKEDLLMDPNDLRKKINKNTKTIIFVNVSGRGNNIFQIKKIAKQNNITLIEDASEALFSKFGKRYYGTIGDIGCFSFAPNKIITTAQGGLIVTNSKKYFNKMSIFKNQGKTNTSFLNSDSYELAGFNFRSTDINASLGLSQLYTLEKRKKKLKQIYKYYQKNIIQHEDCRVINFNLKKGELPLWTEVFSRKKRDIITFLKKNNIYCRSFWKPICITKPYKKNIKNFKNTNQIYKNIFWLPSSLNLKERDQKKICYLINLFF